MAACNLMNCFYGVNILDSVGGARLVQGYTQTGCGHAGSGMYPGSVGVARLAQELPQITTTFEK